MSCRPALISLLLAVTVAGCHELESLPGPGDTPAADVPDLADDAEVVDGDTGLDDSLDVPVDRDAGDATDAPDMPDASDASDTVADIADLSDTTDTVDMPDTMMPPEGPARYPVGVTQSPLTPWVVSRLRSLAATNPNHDARVFAKIGDSITVSNAFMRCFADPTSDRVDLAGRDLQATLAHFAVPVDGGTTPYDRDSLAATVGWSASSALAGAPSPIEQELGALRPKVALVMFGTNDIQRDDLEGYANDMLDVVDTLIAAGTVPIVSTIPPRDDSATADARVPAYNLVVRGIAQGRQVPLVDYHRELLALPGHGLAGDDLHPSTYSPAVGVRPCWLTTEGLQHGYNVRNLVSLEALDRVRRHILADAPEAAPDPPQPLRAANGSPAAPFVIDALPFTHLADTSLAGHDLIDSYGCAPGTDESGPEVYYRLELDAARQIVITVHDRGAVDIDVHLLGASGDPAGACLGRDHRSVVADLAAGSYLIVLDSYVSNGTALSGEYLVTVDAR